MPHAYQSTPSRARGRTDAAPVDKRLPLGLLGVGSGIYVHLFGQVYLSEIVLVLLLPASVLGWRHRRVRGDGSQLRAVQVALWVWFAGLLLGGILVTSNMDSTIQLCAGALVTISDLFVLRRIVRTKNEIVAVIIGIGVGQILSVLLQASPEAAVNAWKFGGGIGVALILLGLGRKGKFARSGLAATAAASLVLDTRSLALIAMSALVLGALSDLLGARLRALPLVITFAAAVGAVGLVTSSTYSALVRAGLFGDQVRAKFDAQGSGSPLLVLLGGRNEIFFSLRSVLTSPILGLGSSPTLTLDASGNGLAQMASFGIRPAVASADLPGSPLPVHSFLMGGWVFGGILGLAAWIVILLWTLRTTVLAARRMSDHRYLILFVGVLLSWNILYSPYGGSERFLLAASMLALSLFSENPIGPAEYRPTPKEFG